MCYTGAVRGPRAGAPDIYPSQRVLAAAILRTYSGDMTTKRVREDALVHDVRSAFADLNAEHQAVLGSLGESRRLSMVFELADFARESYAMQVRMARPDASREELWTEIRRRMWQRDGA